MKKLTAKQARKKAEKHKYHIRRMVDIETMLLNYIKLGFTNMTFETNSGLGLEVATSFVNRKFKVWQRVCEYDDTLITTELEW